MSRRNRTAINRDLRKQLQINRNDLTQTLAVLGDYHHICVCFGLDDLSLPSKEPNGEAPQDAFTLHQNIARVVDQLLLTEPRQKLWQALEETHPSELRYIQTLFGIATRH